MHETILYRCLTGAVAAGDKSNPVLWIVIALAAGLLAGLALYSAKTRKH